MSGQSCPDDGGELPYNDGDILALQAGVEQEEVWVGRVTSSVHSTEVMEISLGIIDIGPTTSMGHQG